MVKRDVEAFNGFGPSAASAVESYRDEEVSQMRKTIARRLAESKFTAPHFYLTMKINMDAMMEARDSINSVSGVKISFNDLVVKACGVALKEHPQVNAAWMEDHIRYNDHVHVGGQRLPFQTDCWYLLSDLPIQNALSEISSEVKDFVIRG